MSNINNKQAVGGSEINQTANEAGFQAAATIVVAGRPEPEGMGTTQNQKGRKSDETASLSPSGNPIRVFAAEGQWVPRNDTNTMKAPWTDKDVSYLNPPTSEVRYVEDAIYLDISFNVTLLPWEKTVSPKSIEREMGFNKYTRSLRGFFEVKVLGTHTYRQDTFYGFVFYGVNMTIRMEKKKPGMGPNMTKTFLVDLCSRLASEVGVYRSAKIIQHFRSTPGRDLQIK